MKNIKKILTLCVCCVLIATLAIGGTLAYLTSEDNDINVMTFGNVKITQHEYARVMNKDGTYKTDTIDNQTSYVLKDFTQGKPLLPIVGDPNESGNSPAYAGWDNTTVRMTQVDSYGSMQVFAGKNAQDKFVTVENTDKSDAYIRTIVAIEIGSTDGSLIKWSARADDTHDGSAPWLSTTIGNVQIDGNTYKIVEYLYLGVKLSDGSWRHENGVLPAGDTTYPSLCQVYLKHNATNQDMEAIDGNGNGTLDILVLSQAVQTAGFADAKTALDTAFGTSAEKGAEWFGGVVSVSGANDFDFEDAPAEAIKVEGDDKAAVLAAINDAQPGDTVILTEDTTIAGYSGDKKLVIDKEITLDLNGKTITTECGWGGIDLKGGASIVNGTIKHTGNTAAIKAFQVDKIENVVIEVTETAGKTKGGIVVQNSPDYYINSIKNVVIKGVTNGIETYDCGDRSENHPFAIGSIENVKINATENGILLTAPIGSVKDCTIKGAKYGILAHLKGTYSVSAALANCIIEGTDADIYAWDEIGKTNPGSVNITYDAAMALNLNVIKNFESEVANRVFVGIK